MKAIIKQTTDVVKHSLIEYAEHATDLHDNSEAKNTKIAYKSDLKHFKDFCKSNDLDVSQTDQQTVALYISYMSKAKYKLATIQRRIQAIANYLRENKLEDVTKDYAIKKELKGAKRELGVLQTRKYALESKDIYKFVFHANNDLKGLRDKALFVIGYSGAFRRSELIALNIDDLDFNEFGVIITIRKSKTDQFGKGSKFALHYSDNTDMCPVLTLQRYIEKAGLTEGALFRRIDRHGNILDRLTTHGLAYILKQYAKELGYDQTEVSGHSLRRGCLTTAAKNNTPINELRAIGRYSDRSSMILRYMQESKMYEFNRTKAIGL
jgi:site-specific recombinase XerD